MFEKWKKKYLCQNGLKTEYVGFHYGKIEIHWKGRVQVDIGKWSFNNGQIWTGKRFIILDWKFSYLDPEWVKLNRWFYKKVCDFYNNQAVKQSKKRGTPYSVGGTKGFEKYCEYKTKLNYWLFVRSV